MSLQCSPFHAAPSFLLLLPRQQKPARHNNYENRNNTTSFWKTMYPYSLRTDLIVLIQDNLANFKLILQILVYSTMLLKVQYVQI